MKEFLISESSPLRILFVEDNETNRFYFRLQLSEYADIIEFAENGQEAILKASLNRYDIIFMDIHLPVMNGNEAARKIKNLNDYYNSIPIIGITNALVPENADTNGINEYFPKIFKVEELQKKLVQWLKKSPQRETIFPLSSPIMQIKDLHARSKMIEIFHTQKNEFLREMSLYIEQNKPEELFFAAHKMKSTIELTGVQELKEIMDSIEIQSKMKNIQEVKLKFEEFKKALKKYV